MFRQFDALWTLNKIRQRYYAKWKKSDRERQTSYDFAYMWDQKNKHKQTKQEQTHKYWEQSAGCQRGESFEG